MPTETRTYAVNFLRIRPDANEEEALDYATMQFQDSPIAVAQFLVEWRNLRGMESRSD